MRAPRFGYVANAHVRALPSAGPLSAALAHAGSARFGQRPSTSVQRRLLFPGAVLDRKRCGDHGVRSTARWSPSVICADSASSRTGLAYAARSGRTPSSSSTRPGSTFQARSTMKALRRTNFSTGAAGIVRLLPDQTQPRHAVLDRDPQGAQLIGNRAPVDEHRRAASGYRKVAVAAVRGRRLPG